MSNEKPGIEETYISAMTSSNLRVEAGVRGDADVIIASGWSHGRIGGALLRLHTEYDACEKPRLVEIDSLLPALTSAAIVEAKSGKLSREQRRAVKAQAQAQKIKHDQNLQIVGMFLARLKSLPDVRTQVTLNLVKLGAEDAETKAISLIRWWLHPHCAACNGTGQQVGDPAQGQKEKACDVCQGNGKSAAPHGADGRDTVEWMDRCIERHHASIGRRLHDRRVIEATRNTSVRADGQPARVFLREKKSPETCG